MDTLIKQILASLREHEGFRNSVYLDHQGYPTIGIGHLLCKSKAPKEVAAWINNNPMTIPDEILESLCVWHIEQRIAYLSKLEWYNKLNDKAKGVVIELCFWLGSSNFVNGWINTVTALQNVDYNKASGELLNSKIGRGEQGRGVQGRLQRLATRLKNA